MLQAHSFTGSLPCGCSRCCCSAIHRAPGTSPSRPRETLRVTDAGAGSPSYFCPGCSGRRTASEAGPAAHGGRVPAWLSWSRSAIGGSSRPERADYSLTAQADRIATVLDTLRLACRVVVAPLPRSVDGVPLAYRRPDQCAGLSRSTAARRSGRDARVSAVRCGSRRGSNCSAAVPAVPAQDPRFPDRSVRDPAWVTTKWVAATRWAPPPTSMRR